jgi:hypothetical protein
MKTYEDFLKFLEDHLKPFTQFVPTSDIDFHAICTAIGRFMLSEPYRWETLLSNWPQTPKVPKPSEKELLDFFTNNKGLPVSFRKELKEKNYTALYKAYDLIYSILILKNEFLASIFREEIRSRKYKKIFKESEQKIKRINAKIDSFKTNQSFLQLIKKFTAELAGFSLTLINNKKLLDQVVDILDEKN